MDLWTQRWSNRTGRTHGHLHRKAAGLEERLLDPRARAGVREEGTGGKGMDGRERGPADLAFSVGTAAGRGREGALNL